MASTTVDYEQGTTSFLIALLEGMIPALNADLAAKVPGQNVSAFQAGIGEMVGAGGNWLTVAYQGESSPRSANTEKLVTLGFNVLAQIDLAGDDTAANYEMAKQVVAAHLRTIFYDDSKVLTPKIDAGLLGIIRGFDGECGPIVKRFPFKLSDGVTVLRGLQLGYQITYSLRVR